jgi:hypothetical protein
VEEPLSWLRGLGLCAGLSAAHGVSEGGPGLRDADEPCSSRAFSHHAATGVTTVLLEHQLLLRLCHILYLGTRLGVL